MGRDVGEFRGHLLVPLLERLLLAGLEQLTFVDRVGVDAGQAKVDLGVVGGLDLPVLRRLGDAEQVLDMV